MRNLTLKEESQSIGNYTCLALVTVLPNSTITQLNKIHKDFICKHATPKIKKQKQKKKKKNSN